MMISLISILTMNHVIGRKNTIPWYFSIDINWFRYHTLNKPVIMGRKTFESLGKKSLTDRFNIVLSNRLSRLNAKFDNIVIVNNPNQALSLVRESDEIMVIGGSSIYNTFFSQCTKMYLTYINVVYNYGDSWFPYYNQSEWRSVFDKRVLYNVYREHYYSLSFKILKRR